MIEFSRGASVRDAYPEQRRAADFEQFVEALRADSGRTVDKDASPYFCAALVNDRKRCAANVAPAGFVAIDADSIAPDAWPAWREFWHPFAAAAWPTHSSTPEKRRERAVIALQRPAERSQVIAVADALAARLEADFGPSLKLDRSVHRPEQPLYLPPAGALLAMYFGDALPVPDAALQKSTLGPTEEHARPTEENAGTYRREQRSTEEYRSHPLCSSVGVIPPETLPAGPGQRNHCLFRLARWARGKHPTATREELRALVVAWHDLALPVIGTTDFATSWADFMRGHEQVKHPMGETMSTILDGHEADQLPDGIERLHYGPAALRLVRVCVRLAAHHAPQPFFLSARQAGEVIGSHYTDAAKMLAAMTADGVLACVERGAGTRAARYAYTWPTLADGTHA